MASQVEIANLILLRVGKSFITSLTDGTEEATKVNAIWDTVRKEVLNEGLWTFATSRATLASTGTAPEYEYDYEFQLPADFIRLVSINEDSPGLYEHRIEGDKLLANISTMKIKYIRDETNTGSWTVGFTKAFRSKMSYEISYLFRSNLELSQLLLKAYDFELSTALATDGTNGSTDERFSNDLIEVR